MFNILRNLIIFSFYVLLTDCVPSVTLGIVMNLKYPYLELRGNYTMKGKEVFDSVYMKKDNLTFLNFNSTNINNPTFTPINGVGVDTTCVIHGAGYITVENYKDTTWGVYEIILFYRQNSSTKFSKRVSVTKQLSWHAVKCNGVWIDVTGNQMGANVFIAATSTTNTPLKFCLVKYDNTETAGYLSTAGCTYTYGGAVLNQTSYQILNGTGFTWTSQAGVQNVNGSFSVANQQYIGRCTMNGVTYLGKIYMGTFFYANNNKENSDCPNHDILLCQP